jgi:hypothetical protein
MAPETTADALKLVQDLISAVVKFIGDKDIADFEASVMDAIKVAKDLVA